MNFLQHVFSEQFIHSLGWTLVHSLWQGALIGLIIAVAMVMLHRYTARLRYFINSLGLFVVAALAVVTFFASYNSYETDQGVAGINARNTMILEAKSVAAPMAMETEKRSTLDATMEGLAAYCREHFPLFVSVWLLGMLAMMLRFMGGYALVRRYKHHRVKPVMGEWEEKFRHLARRIQVNRNVRLLESALVKVPMAIGYLKPVVLLPLGALNGVPAQQMEAILVHELAHIRRRDYLMNLLQSLLEVIFFYHPVVWWLSKNIRIERENICDDIAITITGNTMEFAKALTNIQEINLGSPALAAGLSGKNKNRLVNRIRRIAGKPKMQSGFAEGFIAAGILMISLLGLSAAAMITYPAENTPPMPLSFDESGVVMPGFAYFEEIVSLPDTTDKEKEKQEVEAAVIMQKQELEKAIQVEMEAVEAQMEAYNEQMEQLQATEEYERVMQELYVNKEMYMKQMQAAMEAYKDAMKDIDINGSAGWTLPQLYFHDGSKHFFHGDSLEWTHEYPGEFYFHGDSLTDIYFDGWTDKFEEYEDLLILNEDHLLELAETLVEYEELQEIEMLTEWEPFEHEYNFDYKFPGNISIPGSAERIVTEELYEDDLIEHGREYIVLIGKKQMLINGEKQSRAAFKKYRRLIDSMEEPWYFDEDEDVRIHIGH